MPGNLVGMGECCGDDLCADARRRLVRDEALRRTFIENFGGFGSIALVFLSSARRQRSTGVSSRSKLPLSIAHPL